MNEDSTKKALWVLKLLQSNCNPELDEHKVCKIKEIFLLVFPSIYELFKVENENLLQNLEEKPFIFLCFVAAVDWGAPQPWEVSGVVGVPTGHMKEEEPEEGFSWKAVTGPIPAETSKGWLEEGEPGASSFHSVFQLTKETRVTAPT